MRSNARRGYTLIEVALALALAALVVETSARLLDQIHDEDQRIRRDAAALTREGTTRLWLDDALAHAVTSTDTTRGFRGDEHAAEFDTRCRTNRGWSLPCRAALVIDSVRDSAVLYLRDTLGSLSPLLRRLGPARFLYFDPARVDSSWTSRWQSAATIPAAIAVAGARDTLFIPIGLSR